MVVNQVASGVTFLRAGDAATLSATFADLAGVTVDPGVTTLTITRESDGSAVVTGAATSGTLATPRTYALTGDKTALLDRLTAVWTSAAQANNSPATITQVYEVIGDWLFTVAEARAAHPDLVQATYPDAQIAAARERITEWFEQICGVSFVRRYRRVTLSGDGSEALMLPNGRIETVRGADLRTSGGATWTALTSGELADLYADDGGVLLRESLGLWTTGRRNVRIAYEHGWEHPPEPIKRAAIRLLLAQVFPSNLSDRALSETNSLGTFRLAAPDARTWGRWTGLPEVDVILALYNETPPGVA